MNPTRRQALIEVSIVWAVSIATSHLFFSLRWVPFISNNLMLFTSGIFIYLPALVLYWRKEPFDFFEKTWKDFFYSLRVTLWVTLIIFPLVALGNHFFQLWFFEITFHSSVNPVAPQTNLGTIFLFHLFLVAFPEEFFFRGYFLRRARQIFSDRLTFLGVKVGRAFFFTAAVFALSHSLIVVRWWHFAIFFPALAFGWLREKTQALTAPILFHTLSNLFSTWVGLHYYR